MTTHIWTAGDAPQMLGVYVDEQRTVRIDYRFLESLLLEAGFVYSGALMSEKQVAQFGVDMLAALYSKQTA